MSLSASRLLSRTVLPKLLRPSAPAAAAAGTFSRGLHLGSASLSPRIQAPAPDFRAQAVVNGDFKEVSLSDYRGKYLVLYFYPLDFTFVCPTEIIAFSDR